jgi:Na+/H+ antiporter NhaD/arsenite permease-like protein
MLLSIVAGAILFFTYLVLALGRAPFLKIDRTGAAIVGAALMIATGVTSLDDAYRHVDFRTLVLLFGMMVLIAHLRMARFFDATVQVLGNHIRHPALLLVAVVFASGILSALFVNDTICLVFTPVLIELARARGHKPLPYLLALATGANIGSVATITGNPQNMLIASLSQIRYGPFLAALGPVAIFGLALDALVLTFIFRHELRPGPLETVTARQHPVHRMMMAKGLIVTAGVLAGFLLGWDPAVVAAVAAAALLITRRVNPHKIYRQIDWDLLVLFIGLFVVIGSVERIGLAQRLFDVLAPIGLDTIAGLTVVTTVVGNVISNVPAVMLLSRLVPQLPDPGTSWLTLAMASTLSGNLTLVGSIANLIVLERARKQGVEISFWQYCRVGVPVTLATLLFGAFWLAWRLELAA